VNDAAKLTRIDSAHQAGKERRAPDEPGRTFTITADLDAAVKREIKNLPESAWQPYRTAAGVATDREIAETVHTMNGTEQAFRLIVLRWKVYRLAGKLVRHARGLILQVKAEAEKLRLLQSARRQCALLRC